MAGSDSTGAGQVTVDGRYRVQERIGSGGMADVYRVLDLTTKREIALKRMHRTSEANLLRFRREYSTLAGLKHPRIIEVFDYGIDEGGAYYTMQLLDGADLGAIGPLEPLRACAVLRDVASALAFLHTRRLIHRDVTPRNVRITADDTAKLMDFGVLATVGASKDVAGTPPFVAPESLRGVPLDHRVDLFGLGALAYWLLTGRHAYPASALSQLPAMWKNPVRPPSTLGPHVPAALDELVTSLLSQDPLSRPASAAEVIDRVSAIGNLAPTPELETARGYLASAALVGRESEMKLLTGRLDDALDGRGGAIAIEAAAGGGKTRLLKELAVRAQVAGATILFTDCSLAQGPNGVLREIGREALAQLPDVVRESAQKYGKVTDIVGELKEEGSKDTTKSGNLIQERRLVRDSFLGWLADLSRGQPLLIVLDDFQHCDEASAAVLAAMVQELNESRILLAFASTATRKIPVDLEDVCDVITLRGLDAAGVEHMVRALFGDVPDAKQLALYMHKIATGSPLHSTELARHLVDRGIIRYVNGSWVITGHLDQAGLPKSFADAMDGDVAALDPSARKLGQAMSVIKGEISLAMCVALAESNGEDDVFAAIALLIRKDILIGDGETYRFRHSGMRDALARTLDADTLRALHLRAASAMTPSGELAEDQEEALGWHLLHGGKELEGAKYLERAGRRLHSSHNWLDSAAPLEAALDVLDKHDRNPENRIDIQWMLIKTGAFVDHSIIRRHVHLGLDRAWHYAGLNLAQRLRPLLGAKPSLVVGILWASLRRKFTSKRRRGPTPRDSIALAVQMSLIAAISFSDTQHMIELHALIERMNVFKSVSNGLIQGVYTLCAAILSSMEGLMPLARKQWAHAFKMLEGERGAIKEADRLLIIGVGWNMMSFLAALDQNPDHEKYIARIAETGQAGWEVGNALRRSVYHRGRGEEKKALALLAEIEKDRLALGSTWSSNMLIWASSMCYGFTRDVTGLRRSIEQLEELHRTGHRVDDFLALARGEYLRECGELARSLKLLRHVHETSTLGIVAQAAAAALAETLLALGETKEAADIAREGAQRADGEGFEAYRLRCERCLALAEAGLGRITDAEIRLDAAARDGASMGSPSVLGSLYEAKAEIARQQHDMQTCKYEAQRALQWYQKADNPTLIARARRLAAAPQPKTRPTRPTTDPSTAVAATATLSATQLSVLATITKSTTPEERAKRLTQMLIDDAHARRGLLYLCRAGQLELVTPDNDDGVPAELCNRVQQATNDALAGSRVAVDARLQAKPNWLAALIVARDEFGTRVAGAIVYEGNDEPVRVDPELHAEVAKAFLNAGDVDVTAETSAIDHVDSE